jgi:hypothetical protein
MNQNELPQYHQIITQNKDGKREYISTGATLNKQVYISLPTILGLYDTTDPTIRKYLIENGNENIDYFYSDGRIFIMEKFLKKYWNLKSINKETFHPYRKIRIKGSKIPYLINKQPPLNLKKRDDKTLILNELKKIDWNYFITIHTTKFTTEDDWSLYMMKFMDELYNHVKNPNIKAAYSTEYSLKENDIRVSKYQHEHRHIHLFLYMAGEFVKTETIKELFLISMNKSKFNKNEYNLVMYDKSLWGINYILKEYYINRNSFSISVPQTEER